MSLQPWSPLWFLQADLSSHFAALALCSGRYNFAIIFLSLCHSCPRSLSRKHGGGRQNLLPPSHSSPCRGINFNCLHIDTIAPFSFLQPLPDSSLCPNLSPTCHLLPPNKTHTFPMTHQRILYQTQCACAENVCLAPHSQQDNPKPPAIYDLTLSNSPASTFDSLPCFLDSRDTELIVIPQAVCCFLLPCSGSSSDCLGWLPSPPHCLTPPGLGLGGPQIPALGSPHALCIPLPLTATFYCNYLYFALTWSLELPKCRAVFPSVSPGKWTLNTCFCKEL